MREIALECGTKIKVDDEDFEYLTGAYDIIIDNVGYPICRPKQKYKHKKLGLFSMSMHKILIHPEKTGRSINVDHKDGDKLNNQKDNLRVITHQENMFNRKHQEVYDGKEVSSQFKGVYWHKKNQAWHSQIMYNYRKIFIGKFTNELAAASAYNYKARELHKEFAVLNDIPEMPKEEWMKYKLTNKTLSKYKGVTYDKKWDKWIMQFTYKGKRYSSRFDTELEAAKAYNERVIELKGKDIKINII